MNAVSGNKLRRSKVEVCLHLVWATLGREALLTQDIEPRVYGCIVNEAKRLNCTVLAIGGMEDHIHVVLMLPSSIGIAQLVQQMKGVSSKFANELLTRSMVAPAVFFKWQEGYAALSVSRSHIAKIVAYVQSQKQHHAAETISPEWESTEGFADRSSVR